MTTLLTEINAGYLAAILAGIMSACWSVGWWRGRALMLSGRKATESKLTDAILAILGLLLAFTFSMSLDRHDRRRQMVVVDSNAIGDFYTTCGLLAEPHRSQLREAVRRYTEHRLGVTQQSVGESAVQQRVAEAQAFHAELERLVQAAVAAGTPVTIPLVNNLNALTSSHAARLGTYHDRVPPNVIVLLCLAAIIAVVILGWQHGITCERHLGPSLGFVALVSLVFWVTLDLNQPQLGSIRVSQEPMEQLLKGMTSP